MATSDRFDPFAVKASTSPEPLPQVDSMGSGNSSIDPFGIAALSQTATVSVSPTTTSEHNAIAGPPTVTRLAGGYDPSAAAEQSPALLRPKLMTKVTLYEEVSSVVEPDMTAKVQIEGSLYAQVQCSDAKQNAPFGIFPSRTNDSGAVHIRANAKYGKDTDDQDGVVIHIPKPEIGHVPVAYYSLTETVPYLPVLLERKVTVQGKACRIAVQVRTKLDNKAHLQDITVCVAVPERVDGNTVQLVKGGNTDSNTNGGHWDSLQRTIVWKLEQLDQGESHMFSAQAELWQPAQEGDDIRFPVVLRCSSSADQISTADFDVVPIPTHPARLAVSKVTSFRLLHRMT